MSKFYFTFAPMTYSSHSESEENYLKSLYLLTDHSNALVSTNQVADKLSTKPSSVTDMMKKLAGKGLVSYQPYKGMCLTKEGQLKARGIIRKHRLWETFLVQTLNFSWDEVHDSAEQLEHVNSPLLIDRLDAFLEFPTRDPHGDPIPDALGEYRTEQDLLLSHAPENEDLHVVRVKDSSNVFLKHLDAIKINLNTRLRILEKYPYDQSVRVIIDDTTEHILTQKLSDNLWVHKVKGI